MWKNSAIPAHWEDRLHGKWTGHSTVQSLALVADGSVVAGGLASRELEPEARVVCYDPRDGARKWEWRGSLQVDRLQADEVMVEADGDDVKVVIGAGGAANFVQLKSVWLDARTGHRSDRNDRMSAPEVVIDPEGVPLGSQLSVTRTGRLNPIAAGSKANENGFVMGEYSARAVPVDAASATIFRWINRLLGKSTTVPRWDRRDVLIERESASRTGPHWIWRVPLSSVPEDGQILFSANLDGLVFIAVPRKAANRAVNYNIMRLNANDGKERPLPGSLIRAARLPERVRPLAVVCTPDGRTIAGGRAEDPSGDSWWIGGW